MSLHVTDNSPYLSLVVIHLIPSQFVSVLFPCQILILGAKKRYHRITSIQHHYVYVISLRAFNNVGDSRPYYETLYTETFVTTSRYLRILLTLTELRLNVYRPMY